MQVSARQFLERFLSELVKERYATQHSLFGGKFEEQKHPRESSVHGQHKPGQFAPKNTGRVGAGPQQPQQQQGALFQKDRQTSLFDSQSGGGAPQPMAPPAPQPVQEAMIRRQEVLAEMLGGSQQEQPSEVEQIPEVTPEVTPEVSQSEPEQTPEVAPEVDPEVSQPEAQHIEPDAEPDGDTDDVPQQQGDPKRYDEEKKDPQFQQDYADYAEDFRDKHIRRLTKRGARYEDAEDAFQDAVADGWNNLHQFDFDDPEGDFGAWLWTKVKGKWKDNVRKNTSQKRGSGKTLSLDVPTGQEGADTLASSVPGKSGPDHDAYEEAVKSIGALAKNSTDAEHLISILRGERTYEEAGQMEGKTRQSMNERLVPVLKRTQDVMRERNAALYDLIDSEVERYFRDYTLVPVERYKLKATGNTLFGHLLRGLLTVMAFHLANGAFSAKSPTERQASKSAVSANPPGAGIGPKIGPGSSPPQSGAPQGQKDPQKQMDFDEAPDVDENQSDSPWFDGADIGELPTMKPPVKADPNATTQVLPGAAALYPKPGDTQAVPSLHGQAKQDSPSGGDDTPDEPSGPTDNKHPHVKAGDSQGRGGQFAKKDAGNKATGKTPIGDVIKNPAHEQRQQQSKIAEHRSKLFTGDDDSTPDEPEPPPKSPAGSAKAPAHPGGHRGKKQPGEKQRQDTQNKLGDGQPGQRVSVGGRNGTISHGTQGKHRVIFDDGTHALHGPEELKPEVKVPHETDRPGLPAQPQLKRVDPEGGDPLKNPAHEARKQAEAEKPKQAELPETSPVTTPEVAGEVAPELKLDDSFDVNKIEKQAAKDDRVLGEYKEDPQPLESDYDTPEFHESMAKWRSQKPDPSDTKATEAWKKSKPDDHKAAIKKWQKKQSSKRSRAKSALKDASNKANIEKHAFENDFDVNGFEQFVRDRESFDQSQWAKDRSFQAELRNYMGSTSHTRKAANEGKRGHEEFHDAENALGGNIDRSKLVEHLGHDVQDWDHKAFDMANADTQKSKPGAHDEEWLKGVVEDYKRQLAQGQSYTPIDSNYDPGEDEFGNKNPFSRPRKPGMIDRAQWRADWIASVNRVLKRL